MALKEPGSFKAHRLRVAHLYEAGFSLLLAAKWRQLAHHAAGNGLLHPSQYGGAPGRDSITPALAQAAQHEAARAARAPLATTGYDATSCYGRIIASIAVLAASVLELLCIRNRPACLPGRLPYYKQE